MVYVNELTLPSERAETDFIRFENRTCFNTLYPFKIFPDKGLDSVQFETVTMFYGGNGSGKSTLINVIAAKMNAVRYSGFNSSAFFDKFVDMCRLDYRRRPNAAYVLSSDDVFDYVLKTRSVNERIDEERNELFDRYSKTYFEALRDPEVGRLRGMSDLDRWSEVHEIMSPKKSQSQFVKKRVASDIDSFSNGETALRYFIDKIEDDAVYFLDEPENSLSIEFQLQLAEYIAATARATRSQFIIATHSPIFLAMEQALVYNLDADPAGTCNWTELPNVRKYFEFFMDHKDEF